MTLDDYDAALEAAADEPAFANGEELSWWVEAHCSTCVHDVGARIGDYTRACNLLTLAHTGFTPAEWTPGEDRDPRTRYVCGERRDEATS